MDTAVHFDNFGVMLQFLRKRAGFTLRELGQRVAYSETHLARLEANKRNPDPIVVHARFLTALDLKADSPHAQRLLQLAHQAGTQSPAREKDTDAMNVEQPSNQYVLPEPVTTVLGRELAIADICHSLTGIDRPRLVTLTGTGGIGKTTLAIEVARHLVASQSFPDGICLAELAAAKSAQQMTLAFAHSLQLQIRPDHDVAEAIFTFLKQKRLLLVVDNCEHVIDDCAKFTALLLERCRDVHILATSREALRVRGEQRWPVSALSTATKSAAADLSEASALFVARGRLADPHFSPKSAEDIAVLESISRRLDGVPLAIEIAAAQLAYMTLAEIEVGLDDCFALLLRGPRSAEPRHQTVEATISWSYDLLSAIQRTIFMRLSAFRNGWTMDAAQKICALPSNGEVITASHIRAVIMDLAAKSLIVIDRSDHGARYHFLETIREYAVLRLGEAGEKDVVLARHFDYFLLLAERCDWVSKFGAELDLLLDAVEQDRDNIRQARDYCVGKPELLEQYVRLTLAMLIFQVERGYSSELRNWSTEIYALRQELPPSLRAKATYLLVNFSELSIDIPDSQLADCRSICEQLNDVFGLAAVNSAESFRLASNKRLDDAIARQYQVLDLTHRLDNPYWVAMTLLSLATLLVKRNDSGLARNCLIEALERGQSNNLPFIVFQALTELSQLDITQAQTFSAREVQRQRERQSRIGLASALHHLVRIQLEIGQYRQAELDALECLELWQSMAIRARPIGGIARALQDAGMAAWLNGRHNIACARLEQSIEHYREIGHPEGETTTQVFYGYLLMEMGHIQRARVQFLDALPKFARHGANFFLMTAIAGIAHVAYLQEFRRHAAALFGATAVFERRESLTPQMQYWALSYRAVMASATENLGGSEFSSMWQHGEQLTLDELVRLARTAPSESEVELGRV